MPQSIPKSAALLLIFLAQLAIFGLLAWVSYTRTLDEQEAHLQTDARATAEHIAQAMQTIRIQLESLERFAAERPQWFNEVDERAQSLLSNIVTRAPHIRSVSLLDSQGRITAAAFAEGNASVIGKKFSDREYFSVHAEARIEGLYLSKPILSRVKNNWLLAATRGVRAPSGIFLGVALVSVEPLYFAEKFALIGNLPIKRSVVTDEGVIVAVAYATREHAEALATGNVLAVGPNSLAVAQTYRGLDPFGNDAIVATAPAPGWPLVAMSTMSMDDALAGWKSDMFGLAVALILSAGTLTILVLRLYRQQAATSENERRFRSLIEESIDGVVIHQDGKVIFANDAMAQILDLRYGHELHHRSMLEFAPPYLQEDTKKIWQKIRGTGRPMTRRCLENCTATGRVIYVDILSQLVEWEGVAAIRSSANDVSEQVHLAERERRKSAILSAVNDAHSIYLNETRAGISFDRLLEKILQLSRCEFGLIAEHLKDDQDEPYIRPLAISDVAWDYQSRQWYEDRAGTPREFHRLNNLLGEPFRTGAPVIANDPHNHPAYAGVPDGHFKMENILLLPLMLEGEFLGEVALTNRDGGFDDELVEELSPITQAIARIVADFRSTRLREAAERASKSKSVFLAHMSHELRTPLSGVIANLELLSGTELSIEQVELVEASTSAGRGLLGVIGDTLDFSKIEADELQVEKMPLDPGEMLENVQSIYFAAAQDKNIVLFTAVDARVPRLVLADELRLRQVFSNLVSNSIKFTKKGRICLSLQAEYINDHSAVLHFSVDDTGLGFDPNKAESLFNPFEQVDQTITRNFGGTGLGLTIARRLVELHDGKITCDALPDAGCSFMVRIPVSVTEWGDPPLPHLGGYAVTLFCPQSDPSATLVSALEDAKAIVRIVHHVDALRPPHQTVEDRTQALVIDWNCSDAEAADLVARHGESFEHIFAAVSPDAPQNRRAWLFAGDVRLTARPLDAINLAMAIHGGNSAVASTSTPARTRAVAGTNIFPSGQAPVILVVEDQPMNQMVLRRQLARLGADCDLAENGSEALEKLTENHYDIIITDCSMPVMDGFELTRKLRAQEAAGRPRSVVIALTANAVSGDAQRCFTAGMDAYLSKPIGLADLAAVLERWYRPVDPATPVPQSSGEAAADAGNAAETPINRAALAELVGEDDPEVLDQLVRDFFHCWQGSLAALDRPLDDQDAPGLADAAHAAKGTARYGAAEQLAGACAELEKTAKAQQWTESARIVDQLKQDTSDLETFLTTSGLIEDDQLRRI